MPQTATFPQAAPAHAAARPLFGTPRATANPAARTAGWTEVLGTVRPQAAHPAAKGTALQAAPALARPHWGLKLVAALAAAAVAGLLLASMFGIADHHQRAVRAEQSQQAAPTSAQLARPAQPSAESA